MLVQSSLEGVYQWCCYHIVWEAVPEVHHSVCKVVYLHVETVPWFLKFQGVTSCGSHHIQGDVEIKTTKRNRFVCIFNRLVTWLCLAHLRVQYALMPTYIMLEMISPLTAGAQAAWKSVTLQLTKDCGVRPQFTVFQTIQLNVGFWC